MRIKFNTIRQLLHEGERYLTERGVPNARRNAEWVLAHCLGCHSTELYLDPLRQPGIDRLEVFYAMLERRGGREPLQYILASTEFMALPFETPRGVFIPRPDTETLVEHVERELIDRATGSRRILDLCCGTGVIAVSLLCRVAGATAVAVDVDGEAVNVTLRNAARNGVEKRLRCVKQDAASLLQTSAETFDVVVSNPPYIPTGDIDRLPPEVRDHEPRVGLDGGADGLEFYRRVIPGIGDSLAADGVVAFEIGEDQGGHVERMLSEASLAGATIHRDYAGRDRVIIARKN